MVIHKTVCRDCDNAITHNTECCPLPPTPPAPFPFDFEFFVVAIPLNVPGIILAPDNRNIFSF